MGRGRPVWDLSYLPTILLEIQEDWVLPVSFTFHNASQIFLTYFLNSISRCWALTRPIPRQLGSQPMGLRRPGSFHGKLLCQSAWQYFPKCWGAHLCFWCRVAWAGKGYALLSELLGGYSAEFSRSQDILFNSQNGSGSRRSKRYGKLSQQHNELWLKLKL